MTAPALILLADGSTEATANQVMFALRRRMRQLRPGLSIHLCFAEGGVPDATQTAAALIEAGAEEAVFVPLNITHATDPPESVLRTMKALGADCAGLRINVARPIGPACELLSILDLRLRSALAASHTLELDGLVLSAPDSGDPRGAALLARRARQWRAHHKLPVQLAYGHEPGHSVAAALTALRAQGRRLIAVGSFFLSADHRYTEQAALALDLGAVAVSPPIGPDERLLDLAMARYSVSALELLDTDVPFGGFGLHDDATVPLPA
ncbi:MAG: hypothetical protein FWC46_05000 [Actinomycetia bacterium]|nr:hypothetical protein [Actinomycetes bacterium]